MIELDLELTLRERFPKISDEEWGGMVGEYGPFNTLDQKIATAFAFRIIDEATKHNLKIVKRIRNAFAHAKKPIDFNHELIAEELRKVREPNFDKKFHKKLRKSTYLPQDSYVLLCMAASLHLIQKRVKSLRARGRRNPPAKPIPISPLAQALVRLSQDQNSDPKSVPLSTLPNQSGGPIPPTQGGPLSGFQGILNTRLAEWEISKKK